MAPLVANADSLAGVEQRMQALHRAGDLRGALELGVRTYADEVYGLMRASLGREDAADDAFSRFCEGLTRSFVDFAWRSSFRTWAYAVARHAICNARRELRRRELRTQLMSPWASELEAISVQLRGSSRRLAGEREQRLMALRDQLEPDERELLILRVDRGLSWNDLAIVMLDDDPAPLAQRAARLRQRFQALKVKLRQLGREQGLFD